MTLRSILDITDKVANSMVREARFPSGTYCPWCGGLKYYYLKTVGVFKCAACAGRFSETSKTRLAGQKLTNRKLVSAVYAYCAAKKGISSPELSRMVGMQQGAAYMLLQKFRKGVSASYDGVTLGGTVEIDGAFFGGHIRHLNTVEKGRTRRIGRYHYMDRRTVVVLKQRLGKTLTFVGQRESDAIHFIHERVEDGATVVVDQAHAWDGLRELYDMLRVNHKYSFSANRVNTNSAESYFASLRRSQNGTYHRISGKHLGLYAQEVAWRLDCKGAPTEQVARDLLAVLLTPISPALTEESRAAA